MSFTINERVTWVGKIDWELRSFHGEEYSTHKGSSYNSYLVRDEKTVLMDTVWRPFAKEFVESLKKEVALEQIDCIIMNHGEPDHSGALPELMREIPHVPIYCTKNCIHSLKGHYHQDWRFVEVKTGDRLSIGSREFIFIEARMLHWPDTMFSYLTGDNILFSNDAFGQHYASELMFNDLVDSSELYSEALKYYANILTPFNKLVTNKINEVAGLQVPVSMICPSHGIIWRKEPLQIVEKYLKWAGDYSENQITLIYDSMWDATKKMAEAIAEGIKGEKSDVAIKLYNTAKTDKNDLIMEVFKSKLVVAGSSTINKTILYSMAGILDMMKGLAFKGKKAAAFGSYGWSGESVGILNEELKKCGFELADEGLKLLWVPEETGLEKCREFGRKLAAAITV